MQLVGVACPINFAWVVELVVDWPHCFFLVTAPRSGYAESINIDGKTPFLPKVSKNYDD
jgi:hypothetical protein